MSRPGSTGESPPAAVARRTRALALVVPAVLALGGLVACDAPPELRPDQVLRDSLGLTDRDRVHVVRLHTDEAGVEAADPSEIVVREGDHVALELTDRRARTVRFDTADMDEAAAHWATSADLLGAPLLADSGARWVLDFTDAPPARFPFTVIGNGESGGGAIVVEAR